MDSELSLPLRPPVIVHHKGALDNGSYAFPPNSLETLHASLKAGASFIEIDVMALATDDYLLVHDDTLDAETTGKGAVGDLTRDAARDLFIVDRGVVTAYRPPLLSEVVSLFMEFGGAARLQIDYKNVYPMANDEPLRRLVEMIEPLDERVIVSTGADWHLRRLRSISGYLDLGFDIGFYLDYRPEPVDPRLPPYRLGDYGYHDDHLLSILRSLPTDMYLAERCEILFSAVPSVSTWYVNHQLIARCLDDGFNMAEWLHKDEIKLDAWTLDADNASAATNAVRLLEAGVDQFTTNTPHALAKLIGA